MTFIAEEPGYNLKIKVTLGGQKWCINSHVQSWTDIKITWS